MRVERGCNDIREGSTTFPGIPLRDELNGWSDADVEAYITCLKQEADRHWSIDLNESLKFASIIQHIGHALEKPGYIALGLMAQGDALKNMGRITEAWSALTQAGEMYQRAEDAVGWARTRIGIVFISIEVDKVGAALDEAVVARRILIEHNWLEKCVFLDMNVATIYHRMGDAQKAWQAYHDALQMAQSLGDAGSHLLWPVYYNLAVTCLETSQLQEAEHSFQQAAASAIEHNQTRNAVMAMTGLAALYQMQGRYRSALTLLHQANDMTGDKTSWDLIAAYRVMAKCYLNLNRYYEARDLAKRAVSWSSERKLVHDNARTLFYLATAEASLENYDAALEALNHADTLLEQTPRSVWLSRQHLQRGTIAWKQSNFTEALRQSEKSMFHAAPGSISAAGALLLQGRIHLSQGQPRQAHRFVLAALKIARTHRFITTLYTAFLLLGQIAEADMKFIHARHCYQAAIATLRRSQQDLTLTLRPDFLQDKQEAMHALLRLHLRAGETAEAFMVLEQAKTQTWVNYAGSPEALRWHTNQADSENQVAPLLTELTHLRSEHQWYYNQVHHESPSLKDDAATQKAALERLKECEQQIRTLTERLYLLNEEAFSPVSQPASLDAIQACLADDELLIAYYNDGSTLRAFTLDKTSIRVHELPASVTEIDRLMNKLQANLDWAGGLAPDDKLAGRLADTYRQIAGHLHDKLLGAFAPELVDKKRLFIVPYGSLHYLAFNTLFDGQSYLIEKYSVVVLPVGGLITRTPVSSTPGIRILAHSRAQELPSIIEEAQSISALQPDRITGELYPEHAAQRHLFNLPPAQVLHIAAHGEYRIDTPEFSYILLDDGQVFIDDVLQHDLRYELITLSGCETGRAAILPGDEPSGLGRAFLYAGAASVIASLWRIDDALTAQLIRYFYEHLFAGTPKADALRLAQCHSLRAYPDLHPTYWGALQLIGDPGPLSTVSYSSKI